MRKKRTLSNLKQPNFDPIANYHYSGIAVGVDLVVVVDLNVGWVPIWFFFFLSKLLPPTRPPSLKGEHTYTYEGDRTREDIVAFARRLLGPPVGQIDSEKGLREAVESNEITFVFVGNPRGDAWVRKGGKGAEITFAERCCIFF